MSIVSVSAVSRFVTFVGSRLRATTGVKLNGIDHISARDVPKTAMVLLAAGAEEIEAVSAIDILRRGQMEVTVAGVIGPNVVKCRSDTLIWPDIALEQALTKGTFDVIVLPGGLLGAKALIESEIVYKILQDQEKSNRYIAAICAGPTVLKAHCIGFGKKITSYPSTYETMMEGRNYDYQESPVVVDGKLITSRGPATAMLFSLTILDKICGKNKAQEVAKALLFDYD